MITPDAVKPGQESVWDYPRPAIVEPCPLHLRIMHQGLVIAETRAGFRTLETSHPPSYYFPPDAIAPGVLQPNAARSMCEWKGAADYLDVVAGKDRFSAIAWRYRRPTPAFAMLRDCVAFYAAPFDGCYVDGEKVVPQPGGFYGGWITSRVAGPFKGVAGSRFW